MTMFDREIAVAAHRFGRGGKVSDAIAVGRWTYPVLWVLGALVLVGYLMIGHSSAHNEPAQSSMTDVLNAALGTVLAAGWLIGAAWLGIRSARIPLDERTEDTPTAYVTPNAHKRLPFNRQPLCP